MFFVRMYDIDILPILDNNSTMTSRGKYDISLWEKLREESYALRESQRVKALSTMTKALREYFAPKGMRKAYLGGSIISEGRFYEFSDVDIAVEGMKNDYFSVLSDLESIVKRDVDLIELEGCRFSPFVHAQWIRLI